MKAIQHYESIALLPEPERTTSDHRDYRPNGIERLRFIPLPQSCWLDHYYRPMQARFAAFLDRHQHSPTAHQIVEAEQHEIDLYERFSAFVSYGFYIATRTTD